MTKYIVAILFFLFLSSCTDKQTETDSEERAEDTDKETEDSDFDENYNNFVKCLKDSDCPEPDKEFCDPYGECQCRRGVENAYMIRYKGKCMNGVEGNSFFCNGHSGQFYVDASLRTMGAIAYAKEKDDVVCRCDVGYYGQHCENRIEYNDELIENGESKLTAPNCKKDDDCSEGMKCSESGYCYCDRYLDFSDPALVYYINKALGKPDNSSLNGADLIYLKRLQVSDVRQVKNGECFVNLRQLVFSNIPDGFDFSGVSKIPNLQSIYVQLVDNIEEIDYVPLTDLEKLLFIYLPVNRDNYMFLKDMKSSKNLVSIDIEFVDGFIPPDLKFLSGFTSLQQLIIQSFEDNGMGKIDISSLENNKILMILKLHLKRAAVEGFKVLSKLENLIDLNIQLYEVDKMQLLSEFPEIEKVKMLTLQGIKSDIKMAEKFPQLNFLNLNGEGIYYKNLSFLEGLSGLNTLIFYDDYIDISKKIEENGYDTISQLNNLTSLTISPYKNKSMNWIKNIKYLMYSEIVDVSNEWFPHYKEEYVSNGGISSDFIENLLYLVYYRDRIYHVDEIKGFEKNCSRNGAVCNKEFRKNFYTENENIAVGYSLCGNPVKKNDENIEAIVLNGGILSIGDDWGAKCESFGVGNKILYDGFLRKRFNTYFDERIRLNWFDSREEKF